MTLWAIQADEQSLPSRSVRLAGRSLRSQLPAFAAIEQLSSREGGAPGEASGTPIESQLVRVGMRHVTDRQSPLDRCIG